MELLAPLAKVPFFAFLLHAVVCEDLKTVDMFGERHLVHLEEHFVHWYGHIVLYFGFVVNSPEHIFLNIYFGVGNGVSMLEEAGFSVDDFLREVNSKMKQDIVTKNAKSITGVEDVKKNSGKLIKLARQSMRNSPNQGEFAKLLGVGRTTIICWEKNKTSPTMNDIRKLSEVTGQSVAYFFGEDTLKINQ